MNPGKEKVIRRQTATMKYEHLWQNIETPNLVKSTARTQICKYKCIQKPNDYEKQGLSNYM